MSNHDATENVTEDDVVEETPTDDAGEPDTFPRKVVEDLRKEAAKYRTRAQRADDLAQRVFRLEVSATGRLADPADLPYDEALLDDADALTAAIDALLQAKPHLASRIPRGDVDQGARGTAEGFSLGALIRSRA